jgi:hypothetical protein
LSLAEVVQRPGESVVGVTGIHLLELGRQADLIAHQLRDLVGIGRATQEAQ